MPLCNGANLRPVEWHTEGKLSNTRSYHSWMIENREWFDTTADIHNCAELATEANGPSASTFYSFFKFFFLFSSRLFQAPGQCLNVHKAPPYCNILFSRTGPICTRYRQLPLVMMTEVALCPCICSACILTWDATSYWTPPQARPE